MMKKIMPLVAALFLSACAYGTGTCTKCPQGSCQCAQGACTCATGDCKCADGKCAEAKKKADSDCPKCRESERYEENKRYN